MVWQAPCLGCKYRLYIDASGRFHCAADPFGWLCVSNENDWGTMPARCDFRIEGPGVKVGHRLNHAEFHAIAKQVISDADWKHWRALGICPYGAQYAM